MDVLVLLCLGNPAQTSAEWSDIIVPDQTCSEDY